VTQGALDPLVFEDLEFVSRQRSMDYADRAALVDGAGYYA
jgi:hypothetical protein